MYSGHVNSLWWVHVICGCCGPISAPMYKQAETPRPPFAHHRPPPPTRRPHTQYPALPAIDKYGRFPPPPPRACANRTMTSLKSLCLLAGRRPSLLPHHYHHYPLFPASAIAFSTTSVQRHAMPRPPPPTGFRVGRPQTWEDGGSSLDKAAKYFLMSEMARGMYVVLEQFFRAPYTIMYPFEKVCT